MERNGDRGGHCHPNLTGQVKSWSTPRACEAKGLGPNSKQQGLCNEVVPEASATKATGKLNPRWVETLMGVPANWVKCEEGNRTDELRALGNGVVPATAEKAFRVLVGTCR